MRDVSCEVKLVVNDLNLNSGGICEDQIRSKADDEPELFAVFKVKKKWKILL